jgi:putative ATP-binding cassette transporter
MSLILFLLRASWRAVVLAGLVGAASGAASIALVAMMLRTLRDPQGSSLAFTGLFAALCAVVLLTRIGSQVLLSRLTLKSVSQLRIGLCRRILESPLARLEEIGIDRMLASLTGDVGLVAQAVNGVPVLGVNLVVLVCGAVYLGSLSRWLLLGALVFCALGIGSYWYSSRWAQRYVRKAREAQDVLMKRVHGLIEGVKELKMHHDRRREFFQQVADAQESVRRSQFLGDWLSDAAVSWARLTFFIAIGLLLFAWPRILAVDTATLTAYTLTILYLMSPLEQIVGWLPFLNWASASVAQIDRLGLALHEGPTENTSMTPIRHWEEIEISGVTHTYRREGQPHGFVLGPIDMTLHPGEIVFVIGGNGSGKTTLAKLVTGLYFPENGEIRVDGELITGNNREGYRQLFAVVFDNVVLFDSLWGLGSDDLDQRARHHLRQLELDRVVTVTNGVFSTTKLSRGQRKRLALLTAYLEDRPIYVFDEWAADQDPVFRKIFYLRLLPELKRQGKTVLAITHDDRYFAHADRVIKLEEGKVVEAFRHQMEEQAQLGKL